MAEKKTILCIDDDPDFLEILKVVLEKGGYQVVQAHSAKEGKAKYDAARPDLIVVDCMMEDVDAGVTFTKQIQAAGNKAPVIMMSSVGDGLARSTDTDGLGLAGVLQKPVDPPTLLTLVKAKLAKL